MSDTMRDRAQEHVSRMTEHGLPTGPLTDTNGWLAEALTAFAKAEVERALEEAAKIAERWNSPVTDSEFVNAQAIAAQQIAAYIRTLKESTND